MRIFLLLLLSIASFAQTTIPANRVNSGPASGSPAPATYRALVAADIPTLPWTKITGATTGGTAGQVLTYTSNGSSPTWQDATGGGSSYPALTESTTIVGNGFEFYINDSEGIFLQTTSGGILGLYGGVEATLSAQDDAYVLAGDAVVINGDRAYVSSINGDVEISSLFGGLSFSTPGDWTIDGNAGTAGYVLTSNGAGVTPTWTAPATYTFTDTDFNVSGSTVSLDYTNGQAASGSTKGYLTSADWTTFNNKQATGLSRLLTGTNTFTGAVTDVGTLTNTYTLQIPSIGSGVVYGFNFVNPTAASAILTQNSPVLNLEGQGWKTNSTAGSQSVRGYIINVPILGAANPTGSLRFGFSINGGAEANQLLINSTGAHSLTGSLAGLSDIQFTNVAGSTNNSIYSSGNWTVIRHAGTEYFVVGAASVGFNSGSIPVANGQRSLVRITGFDFISSTLAVPGRGAFTLGTPSSSGGLSAIYNAAATSNSTILGMGVAPAAGTNFRATSGDAMYGHTFFGQVTTAATNQVFYYDSKSLTHVISHTGAEIYGTLFNPVISGAQQPTRVVAGYNSVGFHMWSSVLSPVQITGNQDNYNPTGLTNGGAPYGAMQLRISSDASRDITGITGGVEGRMLLIYNVGAQNIVLKDDVTSTAANRFQLNADYTLLPEDGIFLYYDGTSSRWRIIK